MTTHKFNEEMMNKRMIGLWLLMLAVLTGCTGTWNTASIEEVTSNKKENIKVTHIQFSPDYKHITLDLDLPSDLNNTLLSDTDSVHVVIKETTRGTTGNQNYYDATQPQLTSIRNVVKEETTRQNLKIVALVDLTLPQPIVDEQREALQQIKNVYADDEKIHVSFMYDWQTTKPIPLTNYVLRNYFNAKEGSGKYLFRSIVEKRNEILNPDLFPSTDNLAMLVFSDGEVYGEDDTPSDPDYYQYKAELDKAYPRLVADTLSIYYVNCATNPNGVNIEATGTLQRMCKNYDGLYQEHFNWSQLEADFKRAFQLDYCDYRLTLTNPNRKIYKGNAHTIHIELHGRGDQLMASGKTVYKLGNVYSPIIVNGDKQLLVLIQGFVIMASLWLLIFLMGQFIVPAIRYHLFRSKYVVRYTGKGMSASGHPVADMCYFCKAPFEEGDEIVVKCTHTMHKNCWDENNYHCPEYGRHCKEGAYYYNRHQLFDSHNATPSTRWLLVGCLSAFVAWVAFTSGYNRIFPEGWLDGIVDSLYNLRLGLSISDEQLSDYKEQLNVMPYFGFCIGLCYSLFFSISSEGWKQSTQRVWLILLRTVIGAVGCWMFFAVECVLAIALGITTYSYLIDWIPWTLSSTLILYLLAWRTQSRVDKRGILISCIAGVFSMNIWNFLFMDSVLDYRLLLLFSFEFYSVTLSACISHTAFRSEHFFLGISKGVKPIDIALYKWFRSNPHRVVTLGKSVDCDLQITWDIRNPISPIQAELRMEKGHIKMYALEEGVFVHGKPWPLGKGLKLFHGTSFTIGDTLFTYKEKDLNHF